MNNKPLTETDYENIWDWVYSELSFKPGIQPADWPSIRTEMPFCKFSIEAFWKGVYDEAFHARFINSAIKTFVDITANGETIYALDWQHPCFYFDPRELTAEFMLENESSTSVTSFLPNGDYYIFITKDLQNVWFGHPWEKSVTLIGERLISAAAKNGLPIN